MSDPEPRKRVSGLRVFGYIVASVGLVIIVAALWMRAVASSRAERLQKKLQAEVQILRGRSAARPTLLGAAEPGNAWNDYDAALAEYKRLNKPGSTVPPLSEDRQDKPETLAKLPPFLPAIAALRQGARRAESRKDYVFEQGLAGPSPPLAACNQLATLTLLHARMLLAEGKTGDAVAETLSVVQFGRDLAADGPVINYAVGMGVAVQGLEEVRYLVVRGGLDPADRAALEKAMLTAESTFPSFEDSMIRESMGVEYMLVNESRDNMFIGFLYMNAAQRIRENAERAAAAGRVSWSQAVNQEVVDQTETQKSWNPFLRMTAPSFSRSAGKRAREWRAQVSMLRIALQYQGGATPTPADDPFGAKLLTSEMDGKLRIWSIGPDGVDDGGVGGWKPGIGKDIVLEVGR